MAHEPQLKSINFPLQLYDSLHERLQSSSGGTSDENNLESSFEIRKFENSRSMLISKKDFSINETFFIVQHIWKNDGGKGAFKELEKRPELAEKLAALFNVPPPPEPISSFDFTKEIDVITSMCDSTNGRVEKQLKDCEFDTIDTVMKLLDEDKKESEIDNDNVTEKKKKTKRKCTFEEFKSALNHSGHSGGNENEAYMQKMYENFLSGDADDGHGNTLHYNWSDDGSTVTVFVSIPAAARKNAITSTLSVKSWKLVVNGVQIIKGDLYASVKPDESLWSIESPGVLCMTLQKVTVETLWPELIKGEVGLSRDTIFSTSFLKVESLFLYLKQILNRMWSFNQTYAVMSGAGAKKPVWYVMEEFGSALTHAMDANFQCSPFMNVLTGETCSLLWPIKNISKGSVCTRNFIPQIIPNESIEISRARLKAFTGSMIYKVIEPVENEEKETDQKIEIIHLSGQSVLDSEKSSSLKSLWLSTYDVPEDSPARLRWNIVQSSEEDVDFNLLTLNEASVMLDGDVLPTHEMIVNKSFLQSYINFQCSDFSWFQKSYILPRDLEEFSREVESSNIPYMWMVRQVDRRKVDVEMFVSSSYSRIARMSEVGPIAVSKFIKDQPQFRHRRFVLNYSVILSKPENAIFIYKEPLIYQTKNDYEANAFICEYDTTNDIITERHEKLIGTQDSETYKDFQVAMNKLLLPKDADRGWTVYQDIIFKRIGVLAKIFLKDVVVEKVGACFVLFGVDVILDTQLAPVILDVNGVANPPTIHDLENILEFASGNITNNFVKVI